MDRAVIIRTKNPPLMKRVRNRLERMWDGYSLGRAKMRHRRRYGAQRVQTVGFVIGCQRSGTTMTIRTLERSLDIDVLNETDQRAFCGTRIRDKVVRNGIVRESDAKVFLFKPVCDSHLADELMADHDPVRVIWCYRNYRDVANSAVERWADTTLRWVKDLLSGGGDWGREQWNTEKVTPECLEEVRAAAADGLNEHGAACLFWYMRNRTFFEQNLADNPNVIMSRYEDTVTKAPEEFARLCRFLGAQYRDDMVSRVFTSSIRKKQFPEINRRIEALCEEMTQRLDRARDTMVR